MTYKEKYLEAKEALFAMIDQFMYTTSHNGEEVFYDQCEHAGEMAFGVLGFKDDIISKREFYRLYDKNSNAVREVRGAAPMPFSREEWYLEDLAERQKRRDKYAIQKGKWIPLFECSVCGEIIVDPSANERCPLCKSQNK